LHTKNQAEAERLLRRASVDLDEQFVQMRHCLPTHGPSGLFRPLLLTSSRTLFF
jgi:hypothetical protein